MENNFDMIKIGGRIAILRKANGLTQQELADRLHISFQAVSNWERGESMPDIGKLVELSDILGISVDGLLGKGTTHAPKKQEKVVHVNVEPKPDEAEAQDKTEGFNLLMELAPFIDEETLDNMVLNSCEKLTLSQMIALAPFLSDDTLDKIAIDAQGKADGKTLIAIAPFLSSETLTKLAEKLFSEEL
ncbi:MAG: helix-turn-helix transcriptional regulator [Clostridia bacterium]|nr:helix-turn-helix transcriptional regulator [Clostridia bacterium]